MKICVIGANGYIGARIYNDLTRYHNVIGTFRRNQFFPELIKMDITNKNTVENILLETKPDVIIHVAAIPRRKTCEENPIDAKKINVFGTKNIVKSSNKINAKIIYISSLGAVKPTTLYGRTKLQGEKIVKDNNNGYIILRLSVTFGYSPNIYNNRPFNRIIRTLQCGEPHNYDNSWRFPPTYIGDVTKTLLKILNGHINNRTIPIAIPKLKSKYEIATDVLKPFGKKVTPMNNNTEEQKEKIPEEVMKNSSICSYDKMIQKIINEIIENKIA